jgi:hypothetical protein
MISKRSWRTFIATIEEQIVRVVVCSVHAARIVLRSLLSTNEESASASRKRAGVIGYILRTLWRFLVAVCGVVAVVGRFARTIGSVLQTLCELLEQESAFEAHLHDCSVETGFALTSGIVGFFDVVQATLQLDALSVVGLFYRWREWCVLCCV